MAGKKLEYEVQVDSSDAVSDLKKVGKAGEQAGKDIAAGFDTAESASKKAIAALSAQLDQVEVDAKGAADAVSAIKAHLTVDVDDAKVTQFANDLKNKMGVAFDQVEADAREFAAVLERGVDLSRTTNEIRGVSTELDHVRSNSDQSRSVLANLAGNSAQDLGQLGGVVGSLGVGIGQLAEYAVDGNVALKNLASVAGPMAGLSAAMLVVQQLMKNIAETKAFDKQQAQDFAAAIDDVGDSYAAVLEIAESGGLQARVQGGGFLNEMFPRKETIDLVEQLDSLGLKIADVQEVIRSGARFQDFPDWLAGPSESAGRFRTLLDELDAAGLDTSGMLDALRQVTGAYTDSNIGADAKARVFASTLESVNEQIRAMQVADDPLSGLTGQFEGLNGEIYDLHSIFNVVVDDLRDGSVATDTTAHYIDVLAAALHLTVPEVAALATAQGNAAKSAGDFQESQAGTAESTQATTDALNAQADAYQAALDKQQAMIDAAQSYADAQQAFRDATADLPGIIAETNTVLEDSNAEIEDRTAAMRTQRDETISWIDGLVATRQELEAQNGTVRTAAETQADYAEGLGLIAGQLNDEVIPAVADYYSDLLNIPEDRQTEFEMVLARGDEDEIEEFIAENSGTTEMAISMELEQKHLNEVKAQIGSATQPKTIPVTAVAHTVVAKGVIASSFPPVTVPVNANTNPAKTTMDTFRRNQANTPIYVKVNATTTAPRFVKPSAATAGALGAAPLALTPFEGDDESVGINPLAGDVTVASFGTPVSGATSYMPVVHNHVTIQAAVIGSRFDVQRAVTKALRATRRTNGRRAA